MSDKVFVICPECMLELPLRRTVGGDIGVVSVLGNVLDKQSARDVLGSIEVLRLESPVNELHFVFKLGCEASAQAQVADNGAEFSIESASERNRKLIAGLGGAELETYFWQVRTKNQDGTLVLEPICQGS